VATAWAINIKHTAWYGRVVIALIIFGGIFTVLGGMFVGLMSVWENLDYWLCGFFGFGAGWFACWWLYTNCGADVTRQRP
jgi:hypothetical protein